MTPAPEEAAVAARAGYDANRLAAEGDLVGLLSVQRTACEAVGSELYTRLLTRALVDLRRGDGALYDLLAPHAHDPFGSALALRLLGAVHRLVLDGRAAELAGYYPSVGGHPGPGVEDAFMATVDEHRATLASLLHDGVQTNEVGRSASLVGGFLLLARTGLPLRVFEVGASAGLNLRWDHYRYQAGDAGFGPVASPLCFADPWEARRPDLDVTVEVVERRGCDRAPIDATTDEGRLSLRSFVWPDQAARFARLDAAIEVARSVPAPVDHAEAADWAAERLADPVRGTLTVLVHSIVLQYLPRPSRDRLLAVLADAGRRATRRAPVAWLRMEPGRDGAEVRLTTWPSGAEQFVSTSTFHGPPVRWLA